MKKKKCMYGNYPQRCYVMKAAKELSIKQRNFTYRDLLNAARENSPELKESTLFSIGAVLIKQGFLMKSTLKDKETGKINTYVLTEEGQAISWKNIPTEYRSKKKKDIPKKKVKKAVKEVKAKKKAEDLVNQVLLRTEFVEDVLLYIDGIKKDRDAQRAMYNDLHEKYKYEIKSYKEIIKGKDKTIEELKKGIEILKSKVRDSTGKTVLLKDVARYKSQGGTL